MLNNAQKTQNSKALVFSFIWYRKLKKEIFLKNLQMRWLQLINVYKKLLTSIELMLLLFHNNHLEKVLVLFHSA